MNTRVHFDTRFFKIFRELNLEQHFDSITISSLAGSAKPSPKIFRYALSQHAIDPNEAIHIGDSESEDMEGARQVKILGILVDREKGGSRGENNVIMRLNQVFKALENI